MKVGVLGSGVVGQTLSQGLIAKGHEAAIGTREPAKLAAWAKTNPKARLGDFAQTAAFGDVIVLAVKGTAASEALHAAGQRNLAGKIIIDATNPIADKPPVNGVLQFFTDLNDSLMEKLQREFPQARFVKAFN